MKRLLATAIALSTLGVAPVTAETAQQVGQDADKSSIWLILALGDVRDGGALFSLPMKSMDQCEEQGAIYMSSVRLSKHLQYRGFECLEGK